MQPQASTVHKVRHGMPSAWHCLSGRDMLPSIAQNDEDTADEDTA
jgi:hypothetical protein